MFEIGSSLREARLRQGLDFPEVEQATKIRGKYLRALEDEEFDVLPAQTYVKGFLRAYAEYLGLDGQLYVDEYNSRYVGGAEEEAPLRARSRAAAAQQQRRRRIESRAVVLTLLGIAALAALVIVAWKSGGATEQNIPGLSTQTRTAGTPAAARAKKTHRRKHVAAPRVVLVGARGSSLVTARANGPHGRILFQGSVLPGDRRVLRTRKLWLQASTPQALTVALNGRAVRLPGAGPRVYVLTRAGLLSTSRG